MATVGIKGLTTNWTYLSTVWYYKTNSKITQYLTIIYWVWRPAHDV